MKRLVAVVLLLGLLAGCASLPTSGPIVSEPRRTQDVGSGGVQIQPEPPPQGATPAMIIDGFLQAMATYQSGYSAARQYLTDSAAATWAPESEVLVYADGNAPRITGTTVTLSAPLVGRLERGTLVPSSGEEWSHDFGLVRNQFGQWRISLPPTGIVISRYLFLSSYLGADVYFFDPTSTRLVPDPRHIPRTLFGPQSLVEAVLDGPSPWLAPAVNATLSQAVALAGEVTTDASGMVDIPLQSSVLALSRTDRQLLVSQFVATLQAITSVRSVRLSVSGAAVSVPDSDADGSVPISYSDPFDPVAPQLSTQLFGLRAGLLVRLGEGLGEPAVREVSGEFGTKARAVSSVAVSSDGLRVAVVSGNELQSAQVDGGPASVVLSRPGLLRPQFDQAGGIWALTADGVVVRSDDKGVADVDASVLEGHTVVAFRVSPDGQRIALVIADGGRTSVGLVRVEQPQPGTRVLAGWRIVPLAWEGEALTTASDVGWIGQSTLAVLATASTSTAAEVYTADIEGLDVTGLGRATDWQSPVLATSPSPLRPRVVVLGRDGSAWRYEGTHRWSSTAAELTAVVYPG